MANFFYKGTNSNYFRLCISYYLCHNHSTLYRQFINKWAWLCFDKILFTKQVVSWIWPADHSLPTLALKDALGLRERTQGSTKLEGNLSSAVQHSWRRGVCSLLDGSECAGFPGPQLSTANLWHTSTQRWSEPLLEHLVSSPEVP